MHLTRKPQGGEGRATAAAAASKFSEKSECKVVEKTGSEESYIYPCISYTSLAVVAATHTLAFNFHSEAYGFVVVACTAYTFWLQVIPFLRAGQESG